MGFSLTDLVGGAVKFVGKDILGFGPGKGVVGRIASPVTNLFADRTPQYDDRVLDTRNGNGNGNGDWYDELDEALGGVLPGGKDFFASNGETICGVRAVMPGRLESRVSCPRGYVAVKCPETGARMCMLKPVARSLGLWKPRRKPPISASDWRRYQTADRVSKKLKRIAKKEMPRRITRRK